MLASWHDWLSGCFIRMIWHNTTGNLNPWTWLLSDRLSSPMNDLHCFTTSSKSVGYVLDWVMIFFMITIDTDRLMRSLTGLLLPYSLCPWWRAYKSTICSLSNSPKILWMMQNAILAGKWAGSSGRWKDGGNFIIVHLHILLILVWYRVGRKLAKYFLFHIPTQRTQRIHCHCPCARTRQRWEFTTVHIHIVMIMNRLGVNIVTSHARCWESELYFQRTAWAVVTSFVL